MERRKVRCDDCGAVFTEVYPDGLDGGESYSDPADPKPCDCDSQYSFVTAAFECSLTIEIMDCETPEQAAALAQATVDEGGISWVWDVVDEAGMRTTVDTEQLPETEPCS